MKFNIALTFIEALGRIYFQRVLFTPYQGLSACRMSE